MPKEGGIKLPKVMRDMSNSLESKIDVAKLTDLQIVGYLHFGLSCSLSPNYKRFYRVCPLIHLRLLMDSPTSSYVTRLTRFPASSHDGSSQVLEISKNLSGFGASFLPALVMAWRAKELVKTMVELVKHRTAHDLQDSSWLEEALE
ncbi:hypothetical protein BC940DRAFT_108660 [Gongronella butleri]|nr:hypothetical protein BC940DRAFT_108660 [Gongronella butleri]